jgi:hypothetical protein
MDELSNVYVKSAAGKEEAQVTNKDKAKMQMKVKEKPSEYVSISCLQDRWVSPSA